MTPSPDPAAFERAKASFFDGLRCHQEGRLHDAVTHYLTSLRDAPARASTLTNLAAARLQLGDAEQALLDAEAALQSEPDNLEAMRHRATALAELGRVDDALAAFRAFIAVEPAHAQAWTSIGNLLMEQGEPMKAQEAFGSALRLGGDAELNGFYLAAARAAAGSAQGAAASVHGAAGSAQGAAASVHGLVFIESAKPGIADTPIEDSANVAPSSPRSPPRAYVESLFDRYAADFDEHLVEQLGYDAHHRVVAGLDATTEAPQHFDRALDLGCGTGLCGPLLRTRVSRLVGVDLSAAMLDRARALGMYDRLDHADIATWLDGCDERFDLVIAADVFIYVGALDAVFAGVARVLDAGGTFAFSLEAPPPSAQPHEGFVLLPSMRYAHAVPYVKALAASNGMHVAAVQSGIVRRDRSGPIDGSYVFLRRDR